MRTLRPSISALWRRTWQLIREEQDEQSEGPEKKTQNPPRKAAPVLSLRDASNDERQRGPYPSDFFRQFFHHASLDRKPSDGICFIEEEAEVRLGHRFGYLAVYAA